MSKERSAVERVNARSKVFWGVDDGNLIGSRRFVAQVGVVLAVHAVFATLLASAPRREGTLGKLRLSPIALALRAKAKAQEFGAGAGRHRLRNREKITSANSTCRISRMRRSLADARHKHARVHPAEVPGTVPCDGRAHAKTMGRRRSFCLGLGRRDGRLSRHGSGAIPSQRGAVSWSIDGRIRRKLSRCESVAPAVDASR